MKRTLGSTVVDEQHQQYRPTFIDRQFTVSLLSSHRPLDIKDASTTPPPPAFSLERNVAVVETVHRNVVPTFVLWPTTDKTRNNGD